MMVLNSCTLPSLGKKQSAATKLVLGSNLRSGSFAVSLTCLLKDRCNTWRLKHNLVYGSFHCARCYRSAPNGLWTLPRNAGRTGQLCVVRGGLPWPDHEKTVLSGTRARFYAGLLSLDSRVGLFETVLSF